MWRPTEIEDLYLIATKEDPLDCDVRCMVADTEESRILLRENTYTWIDGNTILAIVGVSPMWKGVGTVWTLISEDARKHGLSLSRGVMRFLVMLREERSYRRLQATVERGDERARRWLLHLGFFYEGTMVAYDSDGKTHDLYARVRG